MSQGTIIPKGTSPQTVEMRILALGKIAPVVSDESVMSAAADASVKFHWSER